MNKNVKIINFAAIIFSIFLSIKFLSLINASLINSYPFITSDGFDWRL
jgi:hypothetical protein